MAWVFPLAVVRTVRVVRTFDAPIGKKKKAMRYRADAEQTRGVAILGASRERTTDDTDDADDTSSSISTSTRERERYRAEGVSSVRPKSVVRPSSVLFSRVASGSLTDGTRTVDDLRTGLGDEIDGALAEIASRLDASRVARLRAHVQSAMAGDLLARLVRWTRAALAATPQALDVLLGSGPRCFPLEDPPAWRGGQRAPYAKAPAPALVSDRSAARVEGASIESPAPAEALLAPPAPSPSDLASMLDELVADREALEAAGLPVGVLRAPDLRELIETHRDDMGPESAAALVSRIYTAQAALDVEALRRIESP